MNKTNTAANQIAKTEANRLILLALFNLSKKGFTPKSKERRALAAQLEYIA